MTTGALIFAQNTTQFDYIKLAVFSASRIIQYLNIPVTLITDDKSWLEKQYPNHRFESIIEIAVHDEDSTRLFHDGSLSFAHGAWKNKSRALVYELTPYDTTLVIDSDYIINSSILKMALSRNELFQAYQKNFDLAEWRDTTPYDRINVSSIPFYWATAFIFQKDPIVEALFELISYVKVNWQYFRILYNIEDQMFRNDFAFSIAIHIMNGKTTGGFVTELPGKMTYAIDKDVLLDMKDSTVRMLIQKNDYLGEYTVAKISDIDVHIMNKASLSRFIDGGNGV